MNFSGADLIRVLDHDPDLLNGVDGATAAHLRQRLVVRRLMVTTGNVDDELAGVCDDDDLGLLVIDGLLIRTLTLFGRESAEIVGPGDVIRPWDDGPFASVDHESRWRALSPATLAVLDAGFSRAVAPWPSIGARLLSRATQRSRMLMYQATIPHIRHAETRVLLALWHLADRWGRVTTSGVVVPVPLTHRLLAHLTCLARPTVTTTLRSLRARGEVERLEHGEWLLCGEPPTGDAIGDEHHDDLALATV